MKCELFDHLNNVIRLDERQAKKIMRKILLAVQNLHENEIIHRDIKLVSSANTLTNVFRSALITSDEMCLGKCPD